MNSFTLSVIIPNYNHGHLIERALDAITGQSFRPIEIIVVDDASEDQSIDVIHRYRQRYHIVQLIRNDCNRGVIASINRGVENAKGDYLYLGGADDTILPGFFERGMSGAELCPHAGFSFADYAVVYPHTNEYRETRLQLRQHSSYISPEELLKIMQQKQFQLGFLSAIIRRSALTQYFPFPPELKWHFDWFLSHALAFQYGIYYIPETLAVFRPQPKSYSNQSQSWKEQKQVLQTVFNLLQSDPYREIQNEFRISASLARLPKISRMLASDASTWTYLTPRMTSRLISSSFKQIVKRISPQGFTQLYRRLFH